VPTSGADAFLPVLLAKLSTAFSQVHLLYGGFGRFLGNHRAHCTDKAQQPLKKKLTSGALSQPCISNQGPTRILPFLYLGSQVDAMNRDVLSVSFASNCLLHFQSSNSTNFNHF
jgi:dual specificity MAP kinase phosphatase